MTWPKQEKSQVMVTIEAIVVKVTVVTVLFNEFFDGLIT